MPLYIRHAAVTLPATPRYAAPPRADDTPLIFRCDFRRYLRAGIATLLIVYADAADAAMPFYALALTPRLLMIAAAG